MNVRASNLYVCSGNVTCSLSSYANCVHEYMKYLQHSHTTHPRAPGIHGKRCTDRNVRLLSTESRTFRICPSASPLDLFCLTCALLLSLTPPNPHLFPLARASPPAISPPRLRHPFPFSLIVTGARGMLLNQLSLAPGCRYSPLYAQNIASGCVFACSQMYARLHYTCMCAFLYR